METSQAVSMLQPFRHPKPGLTIMDKAEEAKKEISQLRIKRQNACDDARITYLEGFIVGSEYAQQESREAAREVAVDFVLQLTAWDINKIKRLGLIEIRKQFNGWKSKQK